MIKKINWNKVLPHVVVLIIFLITSVVYFYPALDGNSLETHDIMMHKGMSKEVADFRMNNGKEALWTNSMFGGMPADQISIQQNSNLLKYAYSVITFGLPRPISTLWTLFLGFYILLMCLKVDPWIALIGSIGFGFSSNFLIGLQAGHMSKINSVAFMPAVIGSFIYAFRGNYFKGGVLFAFFFGMQWWANHPQIIYYTLIVLLFVGLYFLAEHIQNGKIIEFGKRSLVMAGAGILALLTSLPGVWGTYEYSKHTMRGENFLTIKSPAEMLKDSSESKKDGLDSDYILAWSYGTGETFTFVFPSLKGGGNNDPELKNLENLFPSRAEKLTESMNEDLTTLQVDELFSQGGLNLATLPATQERGYYGQQGLTNGPVFIGVLFCLMALLSLIFSDGKLNWILFGAMILTIILAYLQMTTFVLIMFTALIVLSILNKRLIWIITTVTLLTVMLAWGKNFLDFSEIFIKYFPMYSKFRAVTMILVIADMLIPLMAVLFLVKVIEKREVVKENIVKLYIGIGVIAFATLIVWLNPEAVFHVPSELSGTGEMYQNYLSQALEQNPDLKTQFSAQVGQYFSDYSENLKEFRVGIIKDDALKALILILVTFGLIYFFLREKISKYVLVSGVGVMILVDIIPTDLKYLNNKKDEAGDYHYWESNDANLYPFAAFTGDNQIYEMEIAENPWIADSVKKNLTDLNSSSDVPLDNKTREIAKFSVLNRLTNFRVANFQGLTSESRTSYFYKSLGGYHGAKLRRIQDLFDFFNQLEVEQIVNMMNVKYQLQYDYNERNEMVGVQVYPNYNALGSAWIVNDVKFVENADDELMSMKKGGGFNAAETAIVHNEFSSMVSSTGPRASDSKIEMLSYAPNKIEYSFTGSKEETVIFSEIYYPYGWQAYLDGNPVDHFRANYLLRGMNVPQGDHKITFEYSVPAYEIGSTIALLSSLIVLMLLITIGYLVIKEHRLVQEPSVTEIEL
ncbi:MAG: YfhO family protein [Flavobacteriales bacterium]|nr:YfhO family protein [Flavobacteriales bacterium]